MENPAKENLIRLMNTVCTIAYGEANYDEIDDGIIYGDGKIIIKEQDGGLPPKYVVSYQDKELYWGDSDTHAISALLKHLAAVDVDNAFKELNERKALFTSPKEVEPTILRVIKKTRVQTACWNCYSFHIPEDIEINEENVKSTFTHEVLAEYPISIGQVFENPIDGMSVVVESIDTGAEEVIVLDEEGNKQTFDLEEFLEIFFDSEEEEENEGE